MAEITIEEAESQLCPFSLMEECRYGENCAYVHGLLCDMCMQPILHPSHEAQRRHHQKSCMQQHEAEMEQVKFISHIVFHLFSEDGFCFLFFPFVHAFFQMKKDSKSNESHF